MQEPKITYYQDDHNLPIYASLDYGYPIHKIIDVLLMSSMPLERICTVQPLGVSQNAVFLVDIDVINFGDLMTWGCGKGREQRKHTSKYWHQVLLDILVNQIQVNQ